MEQLTESQTQKLLLKVTEAHQQALDLLQQTEVAFARLVPHQILHLLQIDNVVNLKLGEQRELAMTVLYSDIRNFTNISESMSPVENFEFINSFLSQMAGPIYQHEGFIDKYIGDAIMALFPKDADSAVQSGLTMMRQLYLYNDGRERAGYAPIYIGIGLNTGFAIIGTVGLQQRMDSTIIGDTVNTTFRLDEFNKKFQTEMVMTHQTYYALDDPERYKIRFLDRVQLRGKQQPISVYEIYDHESDTKLHYKPKLQPFFEKAIAAFYSDEVEMARGLFKQCLVIYPKDIPSQVYLERCEHVLALPPMFSEPQELIDFKAPLETHVIFHRQDLQESFFTIQSWIQEAIRKHKDKDYLKQEEVLHWIGSELQPHFENEEKFYSAGTYQFFNEHKKEHQHFLQRLMLVLSKYEEPLTFSFYTILTLVEMSSYHFNKFDRHSNKYFKKV